MKKIIQKKKTVIGRVTMAGMAALLTGCSTAPNIEKQVDELYNKMPQEERIAQLKSMYMDDLFNEQGQLDTAKCKELIPYGIGHFSQFALQKPRDPNELRDRVAAVQDWLRYQYLRFDHLSATDRTGMLV